MNFKIWLKQKIYNEETNYDNDFLDEDNLDAKSDEFFSRKRKNEDIHFNLILSSLGLPTTRKNPNIIGVGSITPVK